MVRLLRKRKSGPQFVENIKVYVKSDDVRIL